MTLSATVRPGIELGRAIDDAHAAATGHGFDAMSGEDRTFEIAHQTLARGTQRTRVSDVARMRPR
jgi:hypothetical protein